MNDTETGNVPLDELNYQYRFVLVEGVVKGTVGAVEVEDASASGVVIEVEADAEDAGGRVATLTL
jgi:hypothetical protein